MKNIIALAFLTLVVCGCPKNSSPATNNNAAGGGSGGGGSGGGLFTAAQIVKAWTSPCTPSSDAILGTSYYKDELTLYAGGSFFYSRYLYNSDSPACSNSYYFVIFTVDGTYSVGAQVSGSTTLQYITFNVSVGSGAQPGLMVTTGGFTPPLATTQDAFNDDCGGTSPYCTLVSGTCVNSGVGSGVGVNSEHMLCMHYTFPNTGNSTIYNIGSYDGFTLTLGAGVTGVPGVFTPGAVAASATVPFN